jgi:PST family polysaccharide transporter
MKSPSAVAANGVIWSSLSQGIRIATQLAGILILARLLPASDFGLVAMATIVTGLASLFRDFGTAAAVIQRKFLPDSLLDSVFWLNIGIGIALAIAVMASAPLVARLFLEPRLVGLLIWLSVAFPLGSLGLVQQALLERASSFRPVALSEGVGAVFGLGAAIVGAKSGWGAFSLVAQTLVSAAISTTGFWLASVWRPKSLGSLREARDLWRFTSSLVGFNFFNYFARTADNMLVGKFLGASELGYYTMAYRLMLWPLQNISAVVGRALLPVFSKMQDDHPRLSVAYVRATAAVTLLAAPMMVGLFVLRKCFVEVALGPKWLPVSELLAWLVPVGLLQSIGTTIGTLYISIGRTDTMLRWGVLASCSTVLAFWIGIHWGLIGLVAGYGMVSCILFIPSLLIPYRLVGLRVSVVMRTLAPILFMAVAMAVVIAVIQYSLDNIGKATGFKLPFLVCFGVLVYSALVFMFKRDMLVDIYRVIQKRQ